MLEVAGDLWALAALEGAYGPGPVVAIPTNGVVKANGEAVMGAGVARDARERFPALPRYLGRLIRAHGNVPFYLGVHKGVYALRECSWAVVSFPTKHHFADDADPALIEQSARRLVALADLHGWGRVYLPRVGAGHGRLDWQTQVRPMLEPLLDDRFVAVYRPKTPAGRERE